MTSNEGIVDVDTLGDRTADGLVRHRCICRHTPVLGAHGWEREQYVYKIVIRDRSVTIYFGTFVVSCRDCGRRHRVRMLPRKSTVDMRVLRERPTTDVQH